MNYWLAKTEPDVYSWDDLVKEKTGKWDGVRNFQARNNLKAMQKGDQVFIYHSHDKEIVGVAKVVKEGYPDPTATEGNWVAVDVSPVKKLKMPVSLKMLKEDVILSQMKVVKQSRLSVSPVSKEEFNRILKFSE